MFRYAFAYELIIQFREEFVNRDNCRLQLNNLKNTDLLFEQFYL